VSSHDFSWMGLRVKERQRINKLWYDYIDNTELSTINEHMLDWWSWFSEGEK